MSLLLGVFFLQSDINRKPFFPTPPHPGILFFRMLVPAHENLCSQWYMYGTSLERDISMSVSFTQKMAAFEWGGKKTFFLISFGPISKTDMHSDWGLISHVDISNPLGVALQNSTSIQKNHV